MLVHILEAHPVPPHLAREQAVVDGLVSRYRRAKTQSGSSLKASRIFVKHHPHKLQTTIRIPAAHAQNLQKHLRKSGVGSRVDDSPNTKKYKIVTIEHDSDDIKADPVFKPSGDTFMSRMRKIHRSITTSLNAVYKGTHAVVLHNFKKLRGSKTAAWECVDSTLLDIVERLDVLADESPEATTSPVGLLDEDFHVA